MKTRRHWLVLLVLPQLALAQLSYVESSNGLDAVRFDGGLTEVEIGDVDGDGHADLVTIGDHGSPNIGTREYGIMVYFGDGQGTWTLRQSGDFGYGGVALGDVNGDGLMDVGYAMHHNYSETDFGDQLIEVALGDGSGVSWTPWDDGLATAGETYGMFGTDFADVDGDGDLDLASMSFGCCNGFRVYRNGGDGTWTPSAGVNGGNSGSVLTFGDVNGDGWPDLAVSSDRGAVYVGDGQGHFVRADGNLPGAGSIRRVPSLGDVDGDGRDDLAFGNAQGGIEVWRRNVDGTWSDLGGALPKTGTWEATALHDMDGDGRIDLVTFGRGHVRVWRNDGAGGWPVIAAWNTPPPGYFAAFRVGGDADHNGYADVAIVAEENTGLENRNRLHFYREASLPSALGVRIVRPGNLTRLRAGSASFIDWESAVPAGIDSRVLLAYSLSGTAGPWTMIGAGLPNNGRYQWVAPDSTSNDLRLRVTVLSNGERASAVSGRLRLLTDH
jgi:FG-GAP-like repeat